MREPIFQCPLCESRIDDSGGMAEIESLERGYCYDCESVVHSPEQIGERIHLYTKTALACRPHETLPQLAESCEELAEYVRQLNAEGFEVVQTSGDGHIHVEKVETVRDDKAASSTDTPDKNDQKEEEEKSVEYWF